MTVARWSSALLALGLARALPAQEYAGHPERFGAGRPELRGGGEVRLRVRVDSLAVAAVLHLVPDGPVVVSAVRVLEPGQHDLPVARIVRQDELVRVPFVIGSSDAMGRAAPRRPPPRPAPTPSRDPVAALLILADAPLDSAVLEARLAEGMLVHPDSLAWQVPPALIRDPTTVWAAIRVERR